MKAGSGTIIIQGGKLIDGTGKPPIDSSVIIVHDGRILYVGSLASMPTAPVGAKFIDATGQTVMQIADLSTAPVDMSPLICGKKAKAYIKQREKDFPMGLKGQPTYLADKIDGPVYVATELGSVVTGVQLPRPRPQLGDAVAAN